jgi:hypothetical protein
MEIRKSVCSGTWYSSNKNILKSEVECYLNSIKKLNIRPKIIVVPHAGYKFSGKVAAKAFAQIPKDTKKVIILGTSHHYPLIGASISNKDAYETPLGNVRICQEINKKGFTSVEQAHLREHSIEIELPFLQVLLEDFCIIPILVGKISEDKMLSFFEKNKDALIVVSVDLSHFHSYKNANKLDKHTLRTLLCFDYEEIKKCEVDSPYALASILKFAKKENYKIKLLDYKNSGDITGDKSSVVGYSAIVFY